MTRSSGPLRLPRRVLLAACIILWAGAFTASHVPTEKLPELRVSDKTAHFAGYFVLGAWLVLTLTAYGVRGPYRAALVVGSMALYAALDEMTQPLVNRHADLMDMAADVLGAVTAVGICEPVLGILEARRKRRGG